MIWIMTLQQQVQKLQKNKTSVTHLLLMDDPKLNDAKKDQLNSLFQNIVKIFCEDMRLSLGLNEYAVFEIRRNKVNSIGI